MKPAPMLDRGALSRHHRARVKSARLHGRRYGSARRVTGRCSSIAVDFRVGRAAVAIDAASDFLTVHRSIVAK